MKLQAPIHVENRQIMAEMLRLKAKICDLRKAADDADIRRPALIMIWQNIDRQIDRKHKWVNIILNTMNYNNQCNDIKACMVWGVCICLRDVYIYCGFVSLWQHPAHILNNVPLNYKTVWQNNIGLYFDGWKVDAILCKCNFKQESSHISFHTIPTTQKWFRDWNTARVPSWTTKCKLRNCSSKTAFHLKVPVEGSGFRRRDLFQWIFIFFDCELTPCPLLFFFSKALPSLLSCFFFL